MKEYYDFNELKSTAKDIFETLLSSKDVPLESSPGNMDRGPITPAEVDASVESLRTQAWALAKAFLDKGEGYYQAFAGPQKAPDELDIRQSTDDDDDDEPVAPRKRIAKKKVSVD